jgi:hypothetical protein
VFDFHVGDYGLISLIWFLGPLQPKNRRSTFGFANAFVFDLLNKASFISHSKTKPDRLRGPVFRLWAMTG